METFWSYCDCRCFSIFPFFSVFFSVFVIFRISRDSSWIFIRPSGFGLESWQFPPLHLKGNQNHSFSAPGFAFDFAPAPESFFMLHVRSYWKSAYFPNWLESCGNSNFWSYCDWRCFRNFLFFQFFFFSFCDFSEFLMIHHEFSSAPQVLDYDLGNFHPCTLKATKISGFPPLDLHSILHPPLRASLCCT